MFLLGAKDIDSSSDLRVHLWLQKFRKLSLAPSSLSYRAQLKVANLA